MNEEQREVAERLVADQSSSNLEWSRQVIALLRELLAAEQVQKPVAWHVCSVNSDGSLSLEFAASWEESAHEHINDAINEYDIDGATSWVVRPVYAAPQQPMHCPKDGGECGAGGYCRPEPVQRKPLTDDEALALIRATPQEDVTQEGWIRRQRLSWVRAIERAITGEKE